MLKKLVIAGLCALSAAAIITGCGSNAKPASSAAASVQEKKEITVGATAGRMQKSSKPLPKKLKAKVSRSM